MNLSALAREFKVSRQTIAAWEREGIDLHDHKAIAERKLRMPGKSSAVETPPPGVESITEAKRRRAVALADSAELTAAQQAGKLIDLASVEQAFAAIGYAVRGRVLALPATLVPDLEGRSPAQIHETLTKAFDQLLDEIHNNHPSKNRTATATDEK